MCPPHSRIQSCSRLPSALRSKPGLPLPLPPLLLPLLLLELPLPVPWLPQLLLAQRAAGGELGLPALAHAGHRSADRVWATAWVRGVDREGGDPIRPAS